MSKPKMFITVLGLVLMTSLVVLMLSPVDQSTSSEAFYEKNYAGREASPSKAIEWSAGGAYFSWNSTLPENAEFPALNIFYRSFGDRDNSAIVMIHGWPRGLIHNIYKAGKTLIPPLSARGARSDEFMKACLARKPRVRLTSSFGSITPAQ